MRGIPQYIRKSTLTLLRTYTFYWPLRVFFTVGLLLVALGLLPGIRFLYLLSIGQTVGHVQSLILSAILIIIGVQVLLIGILADLVGFNRTILEETLYRIRKIDMMLPEALERGIETGRLTAPAGREALKRGSGCEAVAAVPKNGEAAAEHAQPMKIEDPSSSSSAPPAPSRRRWAKLALRIGGTVIILSALVAFVSPGELAAAVSRLSPELLLPAVCLYLLLHVLGTLKWQIMINSAGAGLSWGRAAHCYYAGLFANTFLISLVGGDVVRMGMAIRQARSRAGLLVGCLVDRLFDVAGLLAIVLASVLWMPGLLDETSRQLFRGLLLVAGIAVALGLGLRMLLPARRLPYKVRRLLVRVRCAIHAVVRRPHRVLLAIGLGIALQACLVLMNAWLGSACGLRLAPGAWFFAWPLAKIASMLPVSLGGLGVREAALVSLLIPFGADAASVVAAGLAFEAVIIAGGLASGAISVVISSGLAQRFAWPGVLAARGIPESSPVSDQ